MRGMVVRDKWPLARVGIVGVPRVGRAGGDELAARRTSVDLQTGQRLPGDRVSREQQQVMADGNGRGAAAGGEDLDDREAVEVDELGAALAVFGKPKARTEDGRVPPDECITLVANYLGRQRLSF